MDCGDNSNSNSNNNKNNNISNSINNSNNVVIVDVNQFLDTMSVFCSPYITH